MPKIELITFDLDDTFWDIRSVIINAERNSRKWAEDRIGAKISWGTFDDFMNIRNQLLKDDASLEYDLGMLRKKIMKHHTHSYFKSSNDLDQFIEEAYSFFLTERHKVIFYDDVLEVLEGLSPNYALGVLTNGNASVDQLGIGHLFNFSISSMDVRGNKPDPEHFLMAKDQSGVDFRNMLHVGDHPVNDIMGARDLGINTMWFNSQNLEWKLDGSPPIEFNHWSQFTNLLLSNYEQ